jgi:hypothetical protein
MNDPQDWHACASSLYNLPIKISAPPSFTRLAFAIISELQPAHRTELDQRPRKIRRVPPRLGDPLPCLQPWPAKHLAWSKSVGFPRNELCLTFSQVLRPERFSRLSAPGICQPCDVEEDHMQACQRLRNALRSEYSTS